MNKKIFLPIIICVLVLFSFKADEKSEAFGKQFFNLLKESPTKSEGKIKDLFITLKALKTFPKNEIAEFSEAQYNEFIAESINELKENAKHYKIVWKDIKYVKTEAKSDADYGIDLQVIHVYFTHGAHTFKLQLVTIPHENKLKLIRIMYLDYVSG